MRTARPQPWASVLHYRVERYVTGMGYPSPPASELVAGLFPFPTGITDPDVLLALNDRAAAIEQRARTLAEEAIERDDPWVQDFGNPPEPRDAYQTWFEEVTAGAAYLDRWGIDEFEANLNRSLTSHEQASQHDRVLEAAGRARDLVVEEVPRSPMEYGVSGDDVIESPTAALTIEI